VIPIPNIFPPAPNTISGDNVTASRLANSPRLLARAMREFSSFRYIGGLLLPARVQTDSGSINYEEVGEAITASDTPTQVAPGSEYQLTQTANGTIATAAVAKWGQDTILTDEAISRLQFAAVAKSLNKLVNSAKLLIDSAVVSAVNTSISSNTQAKIGDAWTGAAPKILLDVMTAAAAVRNRGLGYEANVLLVSDTAFPYLAADPTIAAAMAREDRSNPVYTGRFPVIAGLEVLSVPAANLPGGAATAAFVLDRNALGFILTENIGGGYMSGGDLVETKSWRTEDTDGVRIRARSIFKAVITDPLAVQRITAVA
jgi:hypothetical protein